MHQSAFAVNSKEPLTHKNKMRTLFVLLSTGLIAALPQSSQAEISKEEKENFVQEYRILAKVAEEFPDKQDVKVIFVDLDFDGREEALATSYGSFYETGWIWATFRWNGTKWEPVKGYNAETKAIQPGSGVYARPGEIFRLREDAGKTQFVVLNRNYDRLAPKGIGALNKSVFQIDAEGVFREDKVESLEHLLAYRGARYAGIVTSLEALKVEEFSVAATPRNQEQNKAQHPTDGAAESEKPKE